MSRSYSRISNNPTLIRRLLRRIGTAAAVLLAGACFLATPGGLQAEEHVVNSAELHRRIVEKQKTRRSNQKQVADFFSSAEVREALKATKTDYRMIEAASPFFSDEELEQLALRTQEIQRDLAAGALNNQQLTYIVIALATAIVVILAT